ncbi:hypothetical protein O1R50_06810 [Glycomyces luteolus]|uniref:Uncharacterized protein n=1 Tax=Glycomyces luteolus TaxID=2670330 RepID=A0A9X3SQW9_9ACTN|nr:hypothetical protein [Glycomyces luteolus]MDA1359324.1 hypothetical protein [Glycomyces luteolus]
MSESASPQRWGEEHMIDLGAVGEPGPAPDPAPSPTRRFLRIPNAALAYAAVAIALAAAAVTVVKWSPLHRPPAESTVADFLEAVHDGDVEAALALTDQKDAEGEFLVPEALDSRWEITEVAQVEHTDNGDGKATAEVYAEIEGPDGSRIGHRYQVAVDRGEAEIIGAMAETEAWGSFDHLDLNGVQMPIDLQGGPKYIMLLPGYYEFYPGMPSTMEFETEGSMLVLGDKFLSPASGVVDNWMPSPWLLVSQEGEDEVNAVLRAFLDDCAVNPSAEACPFKFPRDPDRDLALLPGAQWEVTVYPEVRAERLWYEHSRGFRLESSLPGEARAQAVITEDGETRTALVSCPVLVDGLYAAFDFDAGFSIETGDETYEDSCRAVIEVDA